MWLFVVFVFHSVMELVSTLHLMNSGLCSVTVYMCVGGCTYVCGMSYHRTYD